jgi:large subunit ribosomal protein L24
MNKIIKGDKVVVLTGKDKGKESVVLKLLQNQRVILENVNMVKRHTKANPQQGVPGGIVEKELSIHVSNVALLNPVTNKPDRVGFRILEDGRKVRFFKSNDEVVDA